MWFEVMYLYVGSECRDRNYLYYYYYVFLYVVYFFVWLCSTAGTHTAAASLFFLSPQIFFSTNAFFFPLNFYQNF